eukprot:1159667-Pelagomonas_calceolata.AAC.7
MLQLPTKLLSTRSAACGSAAAGSRGITHFVHARMCSYLSTEFDGRHSAMKACTRGPWVSDMNSHMHGLKKASPDSSGDF